MPDDIFHKDIGAIKQYAISGSPVALPSTQTRESHEKVREDLTKLLHEQFGVTVVCLSHYTKRDCPFERTYSIIYALSYSSFHLHFTEDKGDFGGQHRHSYCTS